MRKPDLFIVGAPKCGTTSLSEYLKQHPEIFISTPKEPHFFGTDLKSHWSNRFEKYRDKEKYLSLFAPAQNEKRIGEASPWYLYSKKAACEIKAFNSSAYIIIMLRNPVDMIFSLHKQQLYNGNEELADFEAALNAEKYRRNGQQIPKTSHNLAALLYRDVARYAEQVQRYLDIFKDKVHFIIFDDFTRDTAVTYQEVLNFLNVKTDFRPEFKVYNSAKSVRNVTMQRYFIVSLKKLRGIKGVVPSRLRRWGVDSLTQLNLKKESPPPISPELRSCLEKEFSPEIEKLSVLLDRDLTYWCKN